MEMEASKGTVFSAAFQPFRRRFAPPGTLWTTSSSGARSCCAWTEQKWVVAGPGERYAQHHWTRPAKYNASVLQKKTTTSSSWIFLVDFLLNTYIYIYTSLSLTCGGIWGLRFCWPRCCALWDTVRSSPTHAIYGFGRRCFLEPWRLFTWFCGLPRMKQKNDASCSCPKMGYP